MKKNLIFTLLFCLCSIFLSQAAVYVNEVSSSGKWIEFYNSGDAIVDMSNYTVTRYNNDGDIKSSAIPVGTSISPNGFIVIYQSGNPSPIDSAIDCQDFGISAARFMRVELKDAWGNIVDDTFDLGNPQSVTVTGTQTWGRSVDGGATIIATDPTPGASNTTAPLPPSDLKLYINEVNSTGKWIEIYNDEDEDIDVSGFTIVRINNDAAIGTASIPTGKIIESKGFIVIYQGIYSGGSAVPPVPGAIDCMTYGISTDRFKAAILIDSDGRIVDETFDIGDPQSVVVTSPQSWAREHDGSTIIVVSDATPGLSNGTPPLLPSDLKLYINEVNSTGKWIEIYNDEDEDIDIGEFTVTRINNDAAIGTAFIPLGTMIESKGFIVIYQGSAAESPVDEAIDCLSYGISTDKFKTAILRDSDGRIVDDSFDLGDPQSVTVADGKSWAREDDGSAVIVAQDPTPGTANGLPTSINNIEIANTLVSVSNGILYLPEGTSGVQLFNISGNLVFSQNSIAGASLDLKFIPKGVYVVKLMISDKIVIKKLTL